MNKFLTSQQNYWDEIQKVIKEKLSPVEYFEFGESKCRFKKDGKYFEIKIKEIKK